MPRQVRLNVQPLIEKRAPGITKLELANHLGISEGTVRAYLDNRWTVLDRNVLERLADFLECDAGVLLETSDNPFFNPFRRLCHKEVLEKPSCWYIRRPDADVVQGGRALAFRDHNAINIINSLLSEFTPGVKGLETSVATPDELDERLNSHSVVVGSPRVNRAAEMVICRTFGIQPFNPAKSAELPFTFIHPGPQTVESSLLQTASDGKRGIWLREANELIEVDYLPKDEFQRLRITRGRDCGVVIVRNYQVPDNPGCVRKLIVLSGFGGTGTEGAAMALARHFRDLEPLHEEKEALVWGIVEVFYRKQAGRTDRHSLSYNWRFRTGGRCPVPFSSRS